MLTPAHWIAPDGECLDVRTSHIAAVIADPARFDATDAWLRAVYAEHGEAERFGCEGRARAAIIRHLVTAGWIRTRRCIRPSTYWSMTIYDFDPSTWRRLQTWVDTGLTADWLKPASELRIYCVTHEKTEVMAAARLNAASSG
ncbi:hypothetical protein [Spiribacter roseus]|uniref:hypothetical protein n=1 Tax=Spiribacter roseus TaxID=1855875 RepID=UPI00133042CE|nr:hypothetical protein [Spiribacter roseus]KAF0282822.1 hypothetical protein BA898_05975 [Spiribacter roseus]